MAGAASGQEGRHRCPPPTRRASMRTTHRPIRGAAPRAHTVRVALAAAAALPLLSIGGCGTAARADDSAPHAASEATTAVRVAPAALVERVGEVRAAGALEARATADLAFQVGGRVERVAVDEGDAVTRGAVLAALDPTDYA